jgi:WD40 repeat protein
LAFGTVGGRQVVAVGEANGRISFRAPDLLKEYASFAGNSVDALAISHDGKLLAATGSWKGVEFQLLSLADLAHPTPLTTTPDLDPKGDFDFRMTAIAFSPTRNLLAAGGDRTIGAVGSDEDAINLWDFETPTKPRLAGMLVLGAEETNYLAFSPDGKLLATAAADVSLWDVPQGTPAKAAEIHPRATLHYDDDVQATHLSFSPDGGVVAAGEINEEGALGRHIHLMDTERGGPWGSGLLEFDHPVDVLAFEPEGKGLLLWSSRGIERVPLDPDVWAKDLCARANRNMSLKEWEASLGSALPYRKTCPNLPAGEGAK